MYKKVIIYYFSGTGNAKQIAAWFSKLTEERSIDCRLFNIEQLDATIPEKPIADALIIIISPVHGFNFPKTTLDFIQNFPKGKNSIVLMTTRAGLKIGRWVTPGLTGVAFILSSIILKCKGYKIKGQVSFDMPSNWISIHPALKEKSIQFIYENNYQQIKKHADKILSGKNDFQAYRDLVQDILISPVSLAYYVAGRFFLAKSFYATHTCNHCGLCEKRCPVKAIKNSRSQPFWTFQCESCMRCMNICPQRAIETAHGLWVVLFILSTITSGLLYALLAPFIQSILIKLTLFSAVLLALLWILYRIQHVLLNNKLIGKLIAFTSLTHYKFWGRYDKNLSNK